MAIVDDFNLGPLGDEPSQPKVPFTEPLWEGWEQEVEERESARHRPVIDDNEFWDSRFELQTIRQFARARRIAPWPLLGCVLARVVCATPAWLTIPPTVGSPASLNLFIGLVGESGHGKSVVMNAADDILSFGPGEPPFVSHALGSGEGIAHAYKRRDRQGNLTDVAERAMFTLDEIDRLNAVSKRTGSTLLSELRSAWSGQQLGAMYVDASKRVPVEKHKYRFCLIAGIQPTRAEFLLSDADAGTPQRFLWLPTADPDAPEEPPEEPTGLLYTPPDFPPGDADTGLAYVPIPESVEGQIQVHRLTVLRTGRSDLESHALLAREKVAVALALLNGRAEMTEDDWRLAGMVMVKSTSTRKVVQEAIADAYAKANKARAEAEATRAVVVQDTVEGAKIKRVARSIKRKLDVTTGQWIAWNDLRKQLASRDRDAMEDAVNWLIDRGDIEMHVDGDSRHLRST